MPINVQNIKFYHPLNKTEGDTSYGGDINLADEIIKMRWGIFSIM